MSILSCLSSLTTPINRAYLTASTQGAAEMYVFLLKCSLGYADETKGATGEGGGGAGAAGAASRLSSSSSSSDSDSSSSSSSSSSSDSSDSEAG